MDCHDANETGSAILSGLPHGKLLEMSEQIDWNVNIGVVYWIGQYGGNVRYC